MKIGKKKFNTLHTQKGFTLIELLIVIIILVIAATIVSFNFSAHKTTQALNNGEDETVSLLNEARSRTLAAENNIQYGVHFSSSKAILFSGTTFIDGAAGNKEVDFDSTITMSSILLAGGGSDVVFQKMTGETSAYGTLILQKTATTLGQKTITITKPGLVSGN